MTFKAPRHVPEHCAICQVSIYPRRCIHVSMSQYVLYCRDGHATRQAQRGTGDPPTVHGDVLPYSAFPHQPTQDDVTPGIARHAYLAAVDETQCLATEHLVKRNPSPSAPSFSLSFRTGSRKEAAVCPV